MPLIVAIIFAILVSVTAADANRGFWFFGGGGDSPPQFLALETAPTDLLLLESGSNICVEGNPSC